MSLKALAIIPLNPSHTLKFSLTGNEWPGPVHRQRLRVSVPDTVENEYYGWADKGTGGQARREAEEEAAREEEAPFGRRYFGSLWV